MGKVEQVARAICARSGESWKGAGSGYRDICTDFARAAIEAMREPTKAMVDAMDGHAGTIAPEYAYEAAIDAALQEQEQG